MRYGIAVLIIAFVAIVSTVVLIGRLGSGSRDATPARITKLMDFDKEVSASVSWTQQGRLVGDDQRRAVRITVTPSKRTVEVLDDYAQRVEKTTEFPNTSEAFADFTRALDGLNFGRERKVSQPDERGVCPLGNRFIYRLTNKSEEVMRTWSDTCSPADGPFGGGKTAATIAQLFKAQITDYSKFVSGIKL